MSQSWLCVAHSPAGRELISAMWTQAVLVSESAHREQVRVCGLRGQTLLMEVGKTVLGFRGGGKGEGATPPRGWSEGFGCGHQPRPRGPEEW